MLEIPASAPERSMRSAFSRALNDDLIRLSAPYGGAYRIVCECSRRACDDVLEITHGDYDAVRAHPTRFIVVPGHELASVQRVVTQTRRVAVIQEQQECLRLQTAAANGHVADKGKHRRVLIVEDEPLTCKLWSINLQLAELVVLQAADGLRALARARSECPDLVLTDAMLPRLNGFRLAEAMGRDEQTRRIPLIFLCGHVDAAAAARAYALGAVAFLTKPCDARALASLAAGVLARFTRDELGQPGRVERCLRADPELVA